MNNVFASWIILIAVSGAFLVWFVTNFFEIEEVEEPKTLGCVIMLLEKEDEIARVAAWKELDSQIAKMIKVLDLKLLKAEADYPCLGLVFQGEEADLERMKQFLNGNTEIKVEYLLE